MYPTGELVGRLRLRLTAGELAKSPGVRRNTLAAAERGRGHFTPHRLIHVPGATDENAGLPLLWVWR